MSPASTHKPIGYTYGIPPSSFLPRKGLAKSLLSILRWAGRGNPGKDLPTEYKLRAEPWIPRASL